MLFTTVLNIATLLLVVTYSGRYAVGGNITKGYYFEKDKYLTWPEASEFCKSKNMTLVNIRDKEEFDYLKAIILQKYNHLLYYWLGAYRIAGVFKWMPSGDTITYFNWHMGQPDNKEGNENCIHTWEFYFDWNDIDCLSYTLPFICEFDPEDFSF